MKRFWGMAIGHREEQHNAEAPVVQLSELDARAALLDRKHERKMGKIASQIEQGFRKIETDMGDFLEKGRIELQGTAQSLRQDIAGMNTTLSDTNQQLAAIRQYAAEQQRQVRRLQEGYDLSVIKNLCRGVIRCIDFMDDCLAKEGADESGRSDMVSAKGDLLFALQSAGVDEYSVEVGSEYRGQERKAEIVGHEVPDSAASAGRIAKVQGRGYSYEVDGETRRIIRPVQVIVYNGSDDKEKQ